jgi:hypothetical protein
MTTPFAGLRGSRDFSNNEYPQDYRELILRLSPNGDAPLYALMSQLSVEPATDPQINWFQEALDVPNLFSATGVSASSTVIDFDLTQSGTRLDGRAFTPGDILQITRQMATSYTHASQELVQFVSTNAGGTQITVVRGSYGTTAVASGANCWVTKIGNAFAEGTASPGVVSRNPVERFNYTQIFKTAYSVTGTAIATNYRTGNPLKNDRIRKLFDHSAAIEYAMLFGRRWAGTGGPNNKPLRTMGGITDPNIGVPFYHLAVSFTEDTLLNVFEPMFQATMPGIPDERIAFVGNGFLNRVNAVIKNSASTQIRYEDTIKVFGMELKLIRFPYGVVGFKTHPLMNRNARYTNSAIVICPPLLVARPLRDTVEQKNIQAPDEDQQKNQFLTEISLEVHFPDMMGHIHYSGL